MARKKRAANRTTGELLRPDEALRRVQGTAQKYLDIAEVILVALNKTGEITLINRKGCRVLGYKESELLGKNWFAVCLPGQIRANVETVFRELIAGNLEPVEYFENLVLTKSGEERIIAWHNSVLEGESGGIIGILSSGEDITERREMEQKLRKSEGHYRSLFEDSPVALWEEDLSEVKTYIDGLSDSGVKNFKEYFEKHPESLAYCSDLVKTVDVNIAALRLYGAKNKKELLREMKWLFMEEPYVLFKEVLVTLCEGQNVFVSEAESYRLTKEQIHISLRWSVAPGFEHNWGKIFASIIDISDRVDIEEKIKNAAREWNTTFDAINDAILLLDFDGRVLRANKALAKWLRKPFEEIIGSHYSELLDCKNEPPGSCPFERMLISRRRETEVLRFFESWREVTVDPVFNESGQLKRAVYILKDIGERKRSEEKIRQQNDFLNTVLESLTHPFYIVDVRDYRVVMTNPAARKVFSKNGPFCYRLTHNRDEPCSGVLHPCPIREVIKNRKPVTLEHIHMDEKDNKRNFEIHAFPIFDDKGEVKQIIEYSIDITERRKAEEMTRMQQQQLLQADKMVSLGILVSGVAHEINNPNNSIALNAQFLEKAFSSALPILDEYHRETDSLHVGGIEYGKFREKVPFLFSGILDSSRRIQHIVQELKSFSRKDMNDMQEKVDLNAVVESALHLINNIIKKTTRRVLSLLAEQEFEVLLLDLNMPHMGGEELLPMVVNEFPHIPVIIITGSMEIDTAVECMRTGAFDYVVKPVEEKRLVSGVQRAIERNRLQRENLTLRKQLLSGELSHPEVFASIVTGSPAMISILKYVEVIATSPEPVLLTGETGVGKELMARAIHEAGSRKGKFVPVNVAGLDDTMFSDTLFGHKKGAFTDARESRGGLIEQASGGTLFLDEIGDLNPTSQVKLLRLLQEREYFPLGSDVARYSDARIVTATNLDLEESLAAGKFRKDLYYRLEVHHIHIPPLRLRREDFVPLVTHFLEEAAEALNKKTPTPPKELFILLDSYPFPGNVREIRALVFNAVSAHTSGILSMETFKKAIEKKRKTLSPGIASAAGNLEEPIVLKFCRPLPTLARAEEMLVKEALKQAKGNRSIAAQLLGISRQTLIRKIKK